jgi:dTDP-4-amino-4,6-dideoxygalactose transaminase
LSEQHLAPVELVPKIASQEHNFRRRALYFKNARAAIAAFVEGMGAREGDTVLCPAYVGWSPHEGSGVFDPLASHGLNVAYYRLNAHLSPDLDDVQRLLERSRPIGAVVIHFFGHVDPTYPELVALVRGSGAWVLEDEAHALLTDLVAGVTGRLGDASVLSLHKMLPVQGGGALLTNPAGEKALEHIRAERVPAAMLWDHDLPAIAARRRENSTRLAALLAPLDGLVEPVWRTLGEADILQTYPVLLRGVDRDAVYEQMNARGYGVVSLYHTLVESINLAEHPTSATLSRAILNLPVHQDIDTERLVHLVAQLGAVLDKVRHHNAR